LTTPNESAIIYLKRFKFSSNLNRFKSEIRIPVTEVMTAGKIPNVLTDVAAVLITNVTNGRE
jgi:hypothetical protein